MNARQKAKKYKKQMDLYKYKADILDNLMSVDMKKRALSRQIQGEIIPLRYTRIYKKEDYYNYRPAIKTEIGRVIGKYLIDNDLLDIKMSLDEETRMIRLDCSLEVIKR